MSADSVTNGGGEQSWHAIKLIHGGSNISAHVEDAEFTYDHLVQRFAEEFPVFTVKRHRIQWQDENGDWHDLRRDVDKDFLKEGARKCGNILHLRSIAIDLPAPIRENEPISVRSLIDGYTKNLDAAREIASRLVQLETIQSILIVTKPNEPKLVNHTREVAEWLVQTFPGMQVYVNRSIANDPAFRLRELQELRGARHIVSCAPETVHDAPIDLIVTLGGDGTVLYASWLFQCKMPPVLPFHLGSLGFLTVFAYNDYQRVLRSVLNGDGVYLNIRMRIHCSVHRHVDVKDAASDSLRAAAISPNHGEDAPIVDAANCNDWRASTLTQRFEVLNELVVDRGAAGVMLEVGLMVNDRLMTSILADGLVVATSTGSTAYSLSAGGSLVHPEQNAILVTPIAPHALTTRPMILPGSHSLRIMVPKTSRSRGWAAFDGRNRIPLERGDSIVVTASCYPLLTICRKEPSRDWFGGLTNLLNWNKRVSQRPLHA